MKSKSPSQISRFKVLRQLGAGAQGAVYLAQDPTLGRQVAIKTLLLKRHSAAHHENLLAEARIVSQFAHPNIVTLYDAGEDAGVPFLVFEYVEGQLLSHLLRDAGALPAARAARYAGQVLRALHFAHQKDVVHRDIKPGNIIIAADDTARVMDFGIAQLISAGAPGDAEFAGTPKYMAPEYANAQTYTARSELFSMGMVLYEMLTGTPAVSGENMFEILHKIAGQDMAAPSSLNPDVPEALDDIVLKALARDPERRFESAAAFESALNGFLDPEPQDASEQGNAKQGTIEFLLRRMRHKQDFPALSNTISAVNRAAASDTEGVSGLSYSILKDFALTNRLLRLVNSAYYGQFGGTISTISRAVVILGYEKVRNIAMTLMLFEHLQNKAHAAVLKDQVIATYFSGILARELVTRAALKEAEEAFICAVFHNLGKLLIRFYFHEEGLEIDRLIEQGWDEPRASAQVLGISSEDLGLGIARYWHFPDKIVAGMQSLREEKVRRPVSEEAKLATLSQLASELCSAISAPTSERERGLNRIVAKYGEALSLNRKHVTDAITQALTELTRDAAILNINTRDSTLYADVRNWVATGVTKNEAHGVSPLQSLIDSSILTGGPARTEVGPETTDTAQRQAILAAGIQDITNSLVANTQLNDILRIILETMYRGIGFSRVLMCIRDPQQNSLKSRFGFGQDADRIIKAGFAVSLNGVKDVFLAAVTQGADIFIDNVNADKIRQHVPDWYRKMVPAKAFALFPVIINKKPVGLFYGDTDHPGWLKFTPEELSLLKTLRNQAVLAIKQQH